MKYLTATIQLRKAFTHYVYYTEKGLNGFKDNYQQLCKYRNTLQYPATHLGLFFFLQTKAQNIFFISHMDVMT